MKTKVVHSQSKSAWNVVGTELGGNYKITRVPYLVGVCEHIDAKNRGDAYKIAEFISKKLKELE